MPSPIKAANATVKLCACGCGEPTKIAKSSDPRHGHVKGQGVRFLKGHSHRGKTVSAETRAKLSAATSGEKNGHWRGNEALYRAMHAYVCKYFPKADRCEVCGRLAKTEYALFHGRRASRNRDDYRELCRKCHMVYDLGGKPHTAEHSEKASVSLRRAWARRKANGTVHEPLRGESQPTAKLTESKVREIREKGAAGRTRTSLAEECGVSRALIRMIIVRKRWAHVP
jgi:hypothetical protein